MIKRVYFLNGKITSLDDIMSHLEDLLEHDGNTQKWADLGVDFEDQSSQTKYMVEIQDKNDFDYIMIQSQWFDTKEQAKQWFENLDWFDKNKLTATIMYADFDEDGDYGDIFFEEDLCNKENW